MKRSVKILMVCLFAVLAMGMVFAGGAKETKSGKVVVKVMAYGDNSNAEGQSFVRIVEAFEAANPNIDIDYEMLYDEAYHQKVPARLASGDVPHVAYMGADARWGTPWKEAGQQVDMTKYLDANQFDLSLIPEMGPAGEKYYVPLGTSNACTVVFANTKLLKDLGLAMPKSYADLKAMVPAAKAAGVEVLSTHGADGWAWGSCFMSAVFSRTTGKANYMADIVSGAKKFTDSDMVAGLEVLSTMVKDGVLSQKAVLIDSGTGLSDYSNGKCIFYVTGQWDAGNITPEAQAITKLIAIPTLPGQKGSDTMAGAWQVGYGITKATVEAGKDVLDASMKFINFLNSEAEVTQRLRDGAIVAPILKGYKVPTDMPTIINEKIALGGYVSCDVIDSFISGAPNDALNAGMQEIVAGKSTAAQVAAKVESLMVR
jgi:raffinose/stachyose/melibiose transport system substrate-binding protein